MKNRKRVKEIFQDAELLYQEALKELEEGKIRDAAEKAWGATLRATNALILARIGKEIDGAVGTIDEFLRLAEEDKEVTEILTGRYFTRQSHLHGDCFYMGICRPKSEVERRIRETNRYIEDAKKLAGV